MSALIVSHCMLHDELLAHFVVVECRVLLLAISNASHMLMYCYPAENEAISCFFKCYNVIQFGSLIFTFFLVLCHDVMGIVSPAGLTVGR